MSPDLNQIGLYVDELVYKAVSLWNSFRRSRICTIMVLILIKLIYYIMGCEIRKTNSWKKSALRIWTRDLLFALTVSLYSFILSIRPCHFNNRMEFQMENIYFTLYIFLEIYRYILHCFSSGSPGIFTNNVYSSNIYVSFVLAFVTFKIFPESNSGPRGNAVQVTFE